MAMEEKEIYSTCFTVTLFIVGLNFKSFKLSEKPESSMRQGL